MRAVIVFLVAVVLPWPTFASDAAPGQNLFFPSGSGRQSLNDYLEYLEDIDGELTIGDIVTDRRGYFKRLTSSKKLGYDYKGKAFWVRFSVDSRGFSGQQWFLTYDYEHIDNLQVFLPQERGWKRVVLDKDLPMEGRVFNTVQYTVAIPASRAPTTYYVRFAPDHRFFPISLSWSGTKGFIESTQYSIVALGLFFGALGAIWFYNLALLIFLRDKLYLYYIYYLGCFAAAFFYIYGAAHLLDLTRPVIERSFAAAGYLAIHGLIIFTRRFLSLDEHSRWLNYYLKFFQWVLIVGAIAAFYQPIGQPFRILNVIILLTVPVIAVAGVQRSKTYLPARLYSVGWALFALALISLAARSLNLLSINLLTTYGVMLATVWEAALFSLALGYRIKLSDAQASEDRLRAVEAERASTRSREHFLSMISHELRSPLTSISFGLDMLELRAGDGKQSDAIGRVRRAVDGLEGQLRDLLTLASGNHGTLEIRPVAFDATQLVVDHAEDRRATAEAKGLQFNVSVPDREVLIVADPTRLGQAINNLISNAIKYTDRGRIDTILEPFDAARGRLRFSVKDTGTGIPGAIQPLVFTPFGRFDAMGRGQEGSGIGLAVVKTVVDHLGGTITVESEEGVGTSFTVEVPVATPAEATGQDRMTKRVLVVDDRDDVLTSLAGLIAELGYSVDQALGPAVGANLLASNIYDVVLVDVDMPIKPGRELAAETRRGGGLNATTWIVAFTAGANRLGAALWPFDAFLPKPVNRHALKATIEAGLAGKARHVSRSEAESGVTMQPGSVP